MDMAQMLGQGQQGAPEQPMPPEDASGQAGPGMPREQAIQVMQKFGITPRDLPMVAQACEALMGEEAEPQTPETGDNRALIDALSG